MAEEDFKISEKPEDREIDVSKVALKTGLLTALCFLLVLILAFTITAFISPKFVSDMSLRIGARNISSKFAVAHYNRTKDVIDLATAVERSISGKNHKNVAKYAETLVDFKNKSGYENFRELADLKDKSLNAYYQQNGMDAKSNYYNFIYGNYVYSLYKVKEKDRAYDIAFLALGEERYTADNPVRKYIDAYIQDAKRPENALPTILENMYRELDDSLVNDPVKKENTIGRHICTDLIRLYEALGNNSKMQNWQGEFNRISYHK